VYVGQNFVWVGRARVWVGHGLPGLIARTATGVDGLTWTVFVVGCVAQW